MLVRGVEIPGDKQFLDDFPKGPNISLAAVKLPSLHFRRLICGCPKAYPAYVLLSQCPFAECPINHLYRNVRFGDMV